MVRVDGDPIEYRQNRFDEILREVSKDAARLRARSDTRRYTAYVLKALAVLGGIAIAAGVVGAWAQAIGILITVAVAIDSISSNHKRLLSETEATYAYEALSDSAVRRHRLELAPILDIKQQGDEDAARSALAKLLDSLIGTLQEGQTRAEKALRQTDLDALKAITLENTPTSLIGSSNSTAG